MKSKLSKIVMLVFLVANLGMAEYIKKDNAVYYKDETEQADERKVENADFKTFVKLNDVYGKDGKSVFYFDKKLEGADVETFQVIGEVNGKDKKYIYNYDEKMEVNPKDFKLYKNKDKLLYFRNNGKLYIGGSFLEVEYVQDLDSFEVIDEGYSKDKYNIYFTRNDVVKLEGADKDSFVIQENENDFSYDKNSVYFMGKKINGISSSEFRIIDLNNRNESFYFLIDNKNLYKLITIFDEDSGKIAKTKLVTIENPKVDTKSFEVINKNFDTYYRDKNTVYYYDADFGKELKKLEAADSNSFVSLESDFGKDNRNIYYNGNKLEGVNSDGFEILDENAIIFKNKNNVYFFKAKNEEKKYKLIPLNFDSSSFKPVHKRSGYFKDKNGIYYFGYSNLEKLDTEKTEDIQNELFFKIEGVDVPTFRELQFGYSKDRNRVYCKNKEVKGADPESFVIFYADEGVVVKDKNRTYENDCE